MDCIGLEALLPGTWCMTQGTEFFLQKNEFHKHQAYSYKCA